jgi:hypothetical protein
MTSTFAGPSPKAFPPFHAEDLSIHPIIPFGIQVSQILQHRQGKIQPE